MTSQQPLFSPNIARLQKWCCGDAGLVHFDLSDGAFRKLAPQVRARVLVGAGGHGGAAAGMQCSAWCTGVACIVGIFSPPLSHLPPQHPPTCQQGKGIIGLAWRPVPCEAAATNGTASSEATAALEQAVGGCMRGQGCGQLQERARRLPSA